MIRSGRWKDSYLKRTEKVNEMRSSFFDRMSISLKFILITSLIVISVMSVGGLFFLQQEKKGRFSELKAKAKTISIFVANLAVDPFIYKDILKLDGIAASVIKENAAAYAFFIDPDGRPLTSMQSGLNQKDPVIRERFSGYKEVEKLLKDLKSAPDILTVSSPISDGENNLGTIVMGLSTRDAEAAFRNSIRNMAILGACLILLLSVAIFITFRLTAERPIRQIIDLADDVAAGNLERELQISSSKEIGHLNRAFNKIIAGFRETIRLSMGSTHVVASSAMKVLNSSEKITESARHESVSSEETARSMEMMASSLQKVSLNTDALAASVEEASATINEMAASIEQVGKNTDFMASSVTETSSTIEEMLTSIEETSRNASAMTESVSEASLTIENLLSSIELISNNTESLRQTVSSTSSVVEEMMRTIQEVADRIGLANRLSQKAYQNAEEGGKAIYGGIEKLQNIGKTTEKTMAIIENLDNKSREISSIIEVIDEIADQTNLLALNAAIEAARAGDAGRGFAVVADEIRKLAERSLEATKEIASVIKEVQTETAIAVKATEETFKEGKEGIELAASSKDAFLNITTTIKETSEIMNEITRSAVELSKAADQAIKYVVDMNSSADEVTGLIMSQADSTDNIRKAIEGMNNHVRRVNIATKEQAVGGKQIRESLERMNAAVQEVSLAVREQVSGARQIVQVMENMNKMTQEVALAISDQKTNSETILVAMDRLNRIASDNLSLSSEIKTFSEETLHNIENLYEAINNFRFSINGSRRCWEITGCPEIHRLRCPAYGSDEVRCWHITGTWCKGAQQGDRSAKIRNCMTCDAYKVILGLNI